VFRSVRPFVARGPRRLGAWSRRAAIAVVTVLSMAMCGLPALARGGGGGHSVVIVTVGGGGVAQPEFRGQPADMALAVTDAGPTITEGVMKLGDVIGLHRLTAADGIVLLEPVKGRHGDIPAGVALARMIYARPGVHPPTWCDVRPTGRILWMQEHDCFQDSTGGGHLDRIALADSLVHFLGFAQSGIQDPVPLERPVAYRPAGADELPVVTLGFKYCDGDGVTGPPRFAVTLSARDESTEAPPHIGLCSLGVWPDRADKTRVDVSGLTVQMTQTAPGEFHFKVIGRLPPGPLAMIGASGPVRSLAAGPPVLVPVGVAQTRSMLVAAGAAPEIKTGSIGLYDTFVLMPVKHGITGTLGNRVHFTGQSIWQKGHHLDAGQPLFGIPVRNRGDGGIIWCAPKQTNGAYHADCLLPLARGYSWAPDAKPALAPSWGSIAFYFDFDNQLSSDPIVDEGPVALPPMTLQLQFSAVTVDKAGVPALVYHIDYFLDWGEGPQAIAKVTKELPPAGSPLDVLGTHLLLKPGLDSTHMIVEVRLPG